MMAFLAPCFYGTRAFTSSVAALVPTGHIDNESYRDYENEAPAACLYLEPDEFGFFNNQLIAT